MSFSSVFLYMCTAIRGNLRIGITFSLKMVHMYHNMLERHIWYVY